MTPYEACWSAEDARKILVTEALEGDDSVFLATHSPITGFDVGGRDAIDIRARDEQAVLDALTAPGLEHAFCVVQGEPGSGKSHLIRWLSVNWPDPNDQKLLLRRADGSLEGALRQLKERLPEFGHLFENLGQRNRKSEAGRAETFLSMLAVTLRPNHFDPKLGDEDWLEAHAPSQVVGHPAVERKWRGPARILALMEGEGQRNSQSASFDLFDIENLAEAARVGVIGSGVIGAAEDLVRRLDREADIIKAHRLEGWNAADLAVQLKDQAKTSLKLADVLNARRNDAIQTVLGVSASDLKRLFREVRKELRKQNRRLVLLLEDITSWEGLDDSLLEVLIFNAAAKDDQATDDVSPLISVVGVTPAYYNKLPGHMSQRITHEIRLGASTGGLQDVASLRDPLARRQFVSRYLSAVRAGLPALASWRKGLEFSPDTPPPNKCASCPHHEPCARVFGEEDGVGLFPFTAHALDRFFEALKENDNRQTWRTPRGLLQAVLNNNLAQPESFAAGRFPTAFIEHAAFREDRRSDRALSNRLEQMIDGRIANPDDRGRMRRMLAYWGDPNSADTTEADGELSFAGAPRGVHGAFGLPWIGGESPTAAGHQPALEVEPILALEPEPAEPPASANQDRPSSAGAAVRYTPQRPGVVAPKPRHATPKRSELEEFRHQLRAWREGEMIPDAAKWNRMLYELLRTLDPRRFSVPPALFNRLLTPDMVKLKGTTGRGLDYFVLEPAPWVVDGFEAYLALKLGGVASVADLAFHREKLAGMMRRLDGLAAAYIARRIPPADGRPWSPVAAWGQVLLARAWLRGVATPTDPLSTQLAVVLSEEGDPASDPRSRSAPWQAWLTATDKCDADGGMRDELLANVSFGEVGGGGGEGLTDVSDLAGALRRLCDTGRMDPAPSEDGGLPTDLRRLRELCHQWNDKVAQIDRVERAQITDRASALSGLLRGRAVATHLARVDAAITVVSDLASAVAPDRVGVWKSAYAKLQERLANGAGDRIEQLIVDLEDPGPPPRVAPRLGWLARTPAKDLEEVLAAAQDGERALETLVAFARDCVGDAKGTASLEVLKDAAARLREAATTDADRQEAAA